MYCVFLFKTNTVREFKALINTIHMPISPAQDY